MRVLLAALAVLMGGRSLADGISVPPLVEGNPGEVVVLGLGIEGTGSLRATAGSGLVYLGAVRDPSRSDARTATLLIRPDARAGTVPVTFDLVRDGIEVAHAKTEVRVHQIAAVDLSVTGASTIVAGARRTFEVRVRNLGNGRDTFGLVVSGMDKPVLSAHTVALDAGASATVSLTVTPLTFGVHSVRAVARSEFDPTVRDIRPVSYRVLAFGNQNPDSPSLNYALPLGASYGSSGLSYFGGIQVGGTLSSIISTADSFAVTPHGHAASIGAFGHDWSALYGFESGSGHSFQVTYLGSYLDAQLDPNGVLTTGVGYASGPISTSYSHTWGPLATDRLSATYSVRIVPGLTVGTGVGLVGEVHEDATYHVSPLARLTVQWTNTLAMVRAAVSVAPWSRTPWQGTAQVYSRQTKPFGVSVSMSTSPTAFSISTNLTETPSSQVTLVQAVDYSGDGSLAGQLGVQYTLEDAAANIVGVAAIQRTDGTWTAAGNLSANISQLPWIATVSTAIGPHTSVAFGESYLGSDFAIGGSIALPLQRSFEPLLGLRGTYAPGRFSIGLGASYDVGTSTLTGSGSLGLQVLPNVALKASAGYGTDGRLTWNVGAAATLLGGFAVPTPVVNALGGLNVGTITGVITYTSAEGTRPAEGLEVAIPSLDRGTKTDPHGRYAFTVPPGTYQLSLPTLPPQFPLPTDTAIRVERQATTRRDFDLHQSYAISGQVYVDVDRVGRPSAAAYGLQGAEIHLSGPDGTHDSTITNQTGDFVFRGLRPGVFTLQVDAASLPRNLELPQATTNVTLGSSGLASASIRVVPAIPTVTNTLGATGLSLVVSAEPTQAPPTALVHITAKAPAATSVSAEVKDGNSVLLDPRPDGSFEGDVQIPSSARGVALVNVMAKGSGRSAEQNVIIFVSSGPLATITLEPAYVEAGSKVVIKTQLLVDPKDLSLRVGATELPTSPAGVRTFTASYTAPDKPGKLAVTVAIGDKELAHATLVVIKR